MNPKIKHLIVIFGSAALISLALISAYYMTNDNSLTHKGQNLEFVRKHKKQLQGHQLNINHKQEDRQGNEEINDSEETFAEVGLGEYFIGGEVEEGFFAAGEDYFELPAYEEAIGQLLLAAEEEEILSLQDEESEITDSLDTCHDSNCKIDYHIKLPAATYERKRVCDEQEIFKPPAIPIVPRCSEEIVVDSATEINDLVNRKEPELYYHYTEESVSIPDSVDVYVHDEEVEEHHEEEVEEVEEHYEEEVEEHPEEEVEEVEEHHEEEVEEVEEVEEHYEEEVEEHPEEEVEEVEEVEEHYEEEVEEHEEKEEVEIKKKKCYRPVKCTNIRYKYRVKRRVYNSNDQNIQLSEEQEPIQG